MKGALIALVAFGMLMCVEYSSEIAEEAKKAEAEAKAEAKKAGEPTPLEKCRLACDESNPSNWPEQRKCLEYCTLRYQE